MKIWYVNVMQTHIYLLTQIHCITAGLTQVLHVLLNMIYYIKTELKLKDIF